MIIRYQTALCLFIITCGIWTVAQSAEAVLKLHDNGYCELVAGDDDMRLRGYAYKATAGGVPFYDLEIKTKDEWEPVEMRWCGTGMGSFTLGKRQQTYFSVELKFYQEGEARVRIRYQGQDGKVQTLISNSVDRSLPVPAWLLLRPNGTCFLIAGKLPVKLSVYEDERGRLVSPDYALEYKTDDGGWVRQGRKLQNKNIRSHTLRRYVYNSFTIDAADRGQRSMRALLFCTDELGKKHKIVSNIIE